MTIEKRGNSYRIKQMYQGKYYSVTVDHKPTQKEATILLAKKMDEDISSTPSEKGSLRDFGEKYIQKKENQGKSPTTIKGYDKIWRNTPEWFLNCNIYDLSESTMQKIIKEYSETHAPKSVKNFHGFWHGVLDEYRPNFNYSIKLPSGSKKLEYEPTTKDIKAILEYSVGTKYENILRLCVLGLRRGEAMCISSADIDSDNVLTVDKDLVLDKNNKLIIKDHPKTTASYRRIPINKELADSIRQNKKAYGGSTSALNKFLRKAQDELGITRFKLHMTRKFCAAHLHKLGYTDEQIMAWLGWDDPSTMASVYRYNLDPAESMASMKISFDDIM